MKNLLLFFLYIPCLLNAQYFEMGASVGGSNYTGELAANSSRIFLKETNLSAGVFARYNINNYLGLRLHLRYAKLAGADANSSNQAIIERNLSFKTNLYEVGLMGEFNLLGYDPNYAFSFTPYIFGGIAYYQFNPQAELDGRYYDLQPLRTEGQSLPEYPDRVPYELNQFAIPFGIGLKYALSENISIGLEVGARKIFTDYLDDVSLTYPDVTLLKEPIAMLLSDRNLSAARDHTGLSRGDTKTADWYFISSFTISYVFLDSGLMGGRKRNRSKMGCPTF